MADVQIAVIDTTENQVNVAVPGVQGPIGLTGSVAIAQDGTATEPGIRFESDTNTGIYRPGADQVAISTGGTQKFAIDSLNGNPIIENEFPTIAPSLDLAFALTKQLDPRVTFTRASSGTFVDSAGVIQTAATDAPRFDHNPTTGESLGLLVEEQRTNLMTYSEQLNEVIWGPVGGTVTANTETSPANTLTADKLIAANGGPAGQLAQGATITSGATVTAFVYAKAGGFDRLELVLLASSNTTPYGRSTFNPNTGVITTAASTSNGGTNASSAVQALSNGWYRFSVTVTYPAVTSAGMRLVVSNSDAANGDGVKGVFLWGAQLEAGAFPTSYIPTTTAAVTRSADVASITGSAFSSWYRQDEGTLLQTMPPFSGTNGAAVLFGVADDFARSMYVVRNTGANNVFVGNSSAQASLRADISDDKVNNIAFAYATDSFAAVSNGGAVATDTSGSVPTVVRLKLGSASWDLSGTSAMSATIKRFTYWPSRLPNSTLQAVTQ